MKKPFKLVSWAKQFAPKALDLVGDVTGIGALNRLSDVITNDNPDELAEHQIAAAMRQKELDLQELELILADVANARNREIELAKTGKVDSMMYVVGGTVLSMFVLCVISVLFFELKNENLAHLIIGEVIGATLTMIAYYYGSSKGSSDKTNLLTKLNNALPWQRN